MTKKTANSDEKAPVDFDTSLDQLQALVERMEKSELPLEEALLEFERGIKLTRDVQHTLSNSEQRVQMLLEKNEMLTVENFDETIQK